MATKIRATWKVIFGVLISIVASLVASGKGARAASPGSENELAGRIQTASGNERKTRASSSVAPSEGIAKKIAPSEGIAKKIAPSEGIAKKIAPSEGIAKKISPSEVPPNDSGRLEDVTDGMAPEEGAAIVIRSSDGSANGVVLPELQEIPMVRHEDFLGQMARSTPVIVMESDREGYLRIPVKIRGEEEALIEQYEQSRPHSRPRSRPRTRR